MFLVVFRLITDVFAVPLIVTEFGVVVHDNPKTAGWVQTRPTVPVNPETGAIVATDDTECPCVTEADVGASARV